MPPCTWREKFFLGKATEHLLGEGISPAHLNDDRLGRVLDKLYYEAGLTQVFVTVAMSAARKFGVKVDSLHLDSSSFHVHGEYASNKSVAAIEPTAIEITYGYSRFASTRFETIHYGLDVQRGWRHSLVPESGRW